MKETEKVPYDSMPKDEILDGLERTKELLSTELPILLAWDAIKAVNEALTFIRRNDELRYQVCR